MADDSSQIAIAIRKAFKVYCDFYAPESDEYLQCLYLFRELYQLREREAQNRNVSVESLISTEHLYMLARTGVAGSDDQGGKHLVKGDTDFIDMALASVPDWLAAYASAKPALLEECKREAASNLSKSNKDYATHLSKMEKKRKKMEDIKKKYTCKKAVYENAKMLDPDGGLLCHTEYKKARWYVMKGLAHILKEGENELVI